LGAGFHLFNFHLIKKGGRMTSETGIVALVCLSLGGREKKRGMGKGRDFMQT